MPFILLFAAIGISGEKRGWLPATQHYKKSNLRFFQRSGRTQSIVFVCALITLVYDKGSNVQGVNVLLHISECR